MTVFSFSGAAVMRYGTYEMKNKEKKYWFIFMFCVIFDYLLGSFFVLTSYFQCKLASFPVPSGRWGRIPLHATVEQEINKNLSQ